MNNLNDDLRRTREALSMAVNELCDWSMKYADAKPDYKNAFAQAVKTASGTQQLRDAEATIESLPQYREYLKAETMKDFLKIKVESLRAELSAVQSQANIIKADRDLAMAAEHATNNIYS